MPVRLPPRWAVAAAYLALTLLLTYPLSINPAGSLLTDAPDTNVFMWTLEWNTHALTSQPFSMFDANIYYPQTRTLAYSDNMIGNVIFAAPVLWLTGNPVLAFNVVAIVCCMLCGFGAYLLARQLAISPAGAFLCGLIYEFAPPRFLRFGQLTLGVHWIPFTLAYLHAYFRDGRRRDLRLAAGFFTLQVLTSGHGAVFVLVAAATVVVYRVVLGEPLALGRRLRDLGVPGVLALLPVVLMVIPYFAVQREMGLRRQLENWAVPAVSFFASPSYVHAWLLSMADAANVNRDALAYLFPGYLPLLLAAVALFVRTGSSEWFAARATASVEAPVATSRAWGWLAIVLEVALLIAVATAAFGLYHGPFRLRLGDTVLVSVRQPWRIWVVLVALIAMRIAIRKKAPLGATDRAKAYRGIYRSWSAQTRDDNRTLYILMLLLGYWLSIGPPLGLWPVVYWLPGFNFIRVPSRFTILSVLSLGVLAGMGFDWLVARVSTWAPSRQISIRRVAVAIFATVLVVEFAVPWTTTPHRVEIPAIDRWLDSQPKPFVVAEVPLPPFGAGGAWERRQTEFMLHATAHWQKTVHGYSGLRPPLHEILFQRMRTFPDPMIIGALRELGVTYIVVHTDLYEPGEWPAVEAMLDGYRESLRLEHVEGSGRVYVFRPAVLNARLNASSSR